MPGGNKRLKQVFDIEHARTSGEKHVELRVWDLPVRLFHWALAVLFVFQLVTGKIGGDLMDWHVGSGYAILTLVLFRIAWGFAGSTHARFTSFVAGPRATLAFARRLFSREPTPYVGHNPLGGWSVIAMVVLLFAQAITGLFANDGVATAGPLASVVGIEASNRISDFHDANSKVLFVLAALHVLAVLYHWLVKKDNLVAAMWTGIKRRPADAPATAPAQFPSGWRAAGALAVAMAVVYLLVRMAPG